MASACSELEAWLVERLDLLPSSALSEGFSAAYRSYGPRAEETERALALVEPQAELAERAGQVFVRARAAEARPRLSAWVAQLPCELGVSFDLPGTTAERALAVVDEVFAVKFESARVRVAITRGRLLEFEFLVPECAVEQERLEDAAQCFLEHLLGDQQYEAWVGSVDVLPAPVRQRGRLVLAESGTRLDYPIFETRALVLSAQEALGSGRELPEPKQAPWYAFDLPELEEDSQAFQPTRRFASTCVPSALKVALEGLPFSAGRYFPDGFELMALEWERSSARGLPLEEMETVLTQTLGEGFRIVGSGFGPDRDWLDLLAPVEIVWMERLLAACEELGLEGSLTFYRSDYRQLVLRLGSS